MSSLQNALYDICQDTGVMGIDFGQTIDPSDEPALRNAITNGLMAYGHKGFQLELIFQDVWKYFIGDRLVEDETGCVIVRVMQGGTKADTILNWAHVNGSINVDTDGDGQ